MDYNDLYQDSSLIKNGSNETYYDYYFDYEDSLLEEVLKWFEALLVVPIGVLGNIFVLCVLLKKKYRNSSTAVFFAALAVSDMAILVTGIYNLLTVRFSAKLDCKIFTYLWISTGQLSSCILATVAIERAFNVMYPHRAKFIFSARNAKIMITTITLFVFGLNAALIVSYDVGGDNFFEEMYCPTTDVLLSSIVHVYPTVDFCLGFALPFLVIATCSITIIIKLKPALFAQKKDNKKMSSVTKTLLSTNVCFLVTLAPSRIYNIIYPIPLVDEVGFNSFLIFSTISQMNAAANFFLYFLNAPVFRGDVKGLLSCQPKNDNGSREIEQTPQSGSTKESK